MYERTSCRRFILEYSDISVAQVYLLGAWATSNERQPKEEEKRPSAATTSSQKYMELLNNIDGMLQYVSHVKNCSVWVNSKREQQNKAINARALHEKKCFMNF